MSDIPSWNHHNPVHIVCAQLDCLAQHVNAQHVLLVTTKGFVKRGTVQRVKDILSTHQVTVWDGVKPNPDIKDLHTATASLRELNIGCVVGLGGGSALDAAKVLATTIPNPAEPSLLSVFRHKTAPEWALRLPLIAIPTTAGTGAEATPFATIWDHEKNKKHSLAGDFVYPNVALLDATLTLSLNEDDTLYPALDALSHALESLWNKNRSQISRLYAYKAIKLWNKAFPKIRQNPGNQSIRNDLMIASTLAGIAISQTQTAIAHAISYNLTLKYGIPHGLACSFTLPFLIEQNIENITVDELELSEIVQAKNILASLDFEAMLSNFATKNQIFSTYLDIEKNTRLLNYMKSDKCRVEEILKSSLE